MSITAATVLLRFHGADREMFLGHIKKAKALCEKHGAEVFRVTQIFTGAHTGDFLVAIRFPSWESYGKSTQAIYSDPELPGVLGSIAPYLVERNILTDLI